MLLSWQYYAVSLVFISVFLIVIFRYCGLKELLSLKQIIFLGIAFGTLIILAFANNYFSVYTSKNDIIVYTGFFKDLFTSVEIPIVLVIMEKWFSSKKNNVLNNKNYISSKNKIESSDKTISNENNINSLDINSDSLSVTLTGIDKFEVTANISNKKITIDIRWQKATKQVY